MSGDGLLREVKVEDRYTALNNVHNINSCLLAVDQLTWLIFKVMYR